MEGRAADTKPSNAEEEPAVMVEPTVHQQVASPTKSPDGEHQDLHYETAPS